MQYRMILNKLFCKIIITNIITKQVIFEKTKINELC